MKNETYRPLTPRRRLLILLLAVATAVTVVMLLLDPPGGVKRPPRTAGAASASVAASEAPGCGASPAAAGCVGGKVDAFVVVPAPPASR